MQNAGWRGGFMKRILIAVSVMWMLLAAMYVPVNAADTTVAGTVQKTNTDVKVYQGASETSDVIAELEAGTAVLVAEDGVEGWCRISVGDVTGYIKAEYLVAFYSGDEVDQEFEQIGNNYHMVFNEVQQLNRQRSQAKIWGTIIAVLTAGVIAAGIIPVIKKNRNDEKNRTDTETIQ